MRSGTLVWPMSDIPEPVVDAIAQVLKYASGATEWAVVKKELLRCLHPNDRRLFSTRHSLTKKHSLNEMEKKIVATWLKQGGGELLVR